MELQHRQARDRSRSERLEGLLAQRTASLERARGLLASARQDLARSREETIRRLAGAIEARSGTTSAHSSRMGVTCAILARRMGMGEARGELIRMASALHDVGKIAIPDVILTKPGPLSASERAVMETHAEVGYHMLAGSGEPLLDIAALIALTHHERVDGGGYPGRLSGDRIPVEGRIAAVADVFDALTNDRPYRRALGVEAAIEHMGRGRGAQFDPVALDSLYEGLDQILAAVTPTRAPRGRTRRQHPSTTSPREDRVHDLG